MIMDDITKKKLQKSQDARDWPATTVLEECLDDVKALPPNFEVRLVIAWWFREPSKSEIWNTRHLCSGVTFPELVALLETTKHDVITKWRDPE
jgi:hypothetical protein